MPETRILRPQIDIGSNILLLLGDVHAAACGIEIEGLRPFDASQGFFDSLNAPLSGGVFVFRKFQTLNFRSMIWAVTTYMTAAKARSMQPYTSREV